MEYRVVEMSVTGERIEREVAFESAYDAVDFITAAWHRRSVRAQRLHIIDSQGRVLLRPEDVAGISLAAAAW